MKVKLIIEDKKKGKIEIPVANREIRDIYNVGYMIEEDSWEIIKLNKCDKSWLSFHRKIEHIIHDILGEGKNYSMEKAKNSKTKFILNKKRCYIVKKPKWSKIMEKTRN